MSVYIPKSNSYLHIYIKNIPEALLKLDWVCKFLKVIGTYIYIYQKYNWDFAKAWMSGYIPKSNRYLHIHISKT